MDLKTDQTSILLVVYSAFSEAVVNGIWHKVGAGSLPLFIVVVSIVLLAIVVPRHLCGAMMASTKQMKLRLLLRFEEEAQRAVPMANILFPVLANWDDTGIAADDFSLRSADGPPCWRASL